MSALSYERCPVHGRQVAFVHGKLAGVCDACASEAAIALHRLKKMECPNLRLAARV